MMVKDMNGVGVGGDDVSSSSTSSSSNGAGAVLRPQGNIRKNRKPEDVQLFLRRLKQYLLYSKLRSLIPSPTQQEQEQEQEQPFHIDHQLGGRHEEEEATEVEMELHEIPIAYRSDSEHDDHEENINVITIPKTNTNIGNDDDHYDLLVLKTKQEQDEDEEDEEEQDEDEDEDGEEEDGTCVTTIIFESDDEEEKQSEKAFVSSVKIERMENTILINTVVLKQKALTSSLFKILEEENLDIQFENQYRTETIVCHTIQVRLVQQTTADDHQYNVDRLEKRLQKWAKGEPEHML